MMASPPQKKKVRLKTRFLPSFVIPIVGLYSPVAPMLKGAGGVGAVERIALGQSNRYVLFLAPGVVKIDGLFAIITGEQRAHSVFKECRLQEQSFACALRIARNSDVIAVDEWLDRISYVLDLDVRQLGSTHSLFDDGPQSILTLLG